MTSALSAIHSHIEAFRFYIIIYKKVFLTSRGGWKSEKSRLISICGVIRKEMCPVTLNGLRIPQTKDGKYSKVYFDYRLNWKKHIFTERK